MLKAFLYLSLDLNIIELKFEQRSKMEVDDEILIDFEKDEIEVDFGSRDPSTSSFTSSSTAGNIAFSLPNIGI